MEIKLVTEYFASQKGIKLKILLEKFSISCQNNLFTFTRTTEGFDSTGRTAGAAYLGISKPI